MPNRRFDEMAVVLLAAGRSTRFGGNKLDAMLAGRPLVEFAAETLGKFVFRTMIAVCSGTTHGLERLGFSCVMMDEKNAPMSASLAAGVAAAEQTGPNALLVALADMPFVTAEHFSALADAYDGNLAASCKDGTAMPPAIFSSSHFDRLKTLAGDRGARELLRRAKCVDLPPDASFDIDTQEDLAQAEFLLKSRDGAV